MRRLMFILIFMAWTLESCVHKEVKEAAPKERNVSSTLTGTTLDGIRINPVDYSLAPEWKFKMLTVSSYGGLSPLEKNSFRMDSIQAITDFEKAIELLLTTEKNTDEKKIIRAGDADIRPFVTDVKKGAKKSLAEILKLTAYLKKIPENQWGTSADALDARFQIVELVDTFNLNFQYPVDRDHWFPFVPFYALSQLGNIPATRRAQRAVNIPEQPTGVDLSTVDPHDSSFWINPVNVSTRDTFFGFDRTEMFKLDAKCAYDEPKTSYGIHGGFTVKCGKNKFGLKFGSETHSEPFNVRIAWALGYPSLPVDYVAALELPYDRKILKEYNSRKDLSYRITLFGEIDDHKTELAKLGLQGYLDPFEEAIAGAVLKSGVRIGSKELRKALIRTNRPKDEANDANYNEAFESSIDKLILFPLSAELKNNKDYENLGPWDWNSLGHYRRREVRAFGLFAAFVGLYDTRFDNNKLRLQTTEEGVTQLVHFVSDMGSGLGNSSDVLAYTNSKVNDYKWNFISKRSPHGGTRNLPEREKQPFYITGYTSIQSNESFRYMGYDDARWMARKIAQLTEQQWKSALIASGFSSAEVFLYMEKIASRRDEMIKTLDLQDEIRFFRTRARKDANYDPYSDGVQFVKLITGKNHPAPLKGNQRVIKGKLLE